MKFIQTLPFVALAAALIIPDDETLQRLALKPADETDDGSLWHAASDGADALFSHLKDTVHSAKEDLKSAIAHARNDVEEEIRNASAEDDDVADHPGHGHHPGHGRHGHHSDLTIYQFISQDKHTTKFAELVNDYDDIVQLLNSTKANYTLFVPIDPAFEHLPDKKPPKEFVEALLKYHIGLDVYTSHRILVTQTIPTALDEKFLWGEPQRLRTSVGLTGIKVNFYSKVFATNFVAKNGIIHPVNHILIPPPFIGRELSLFPNVFSTLLLAYEKTDFVKFIHGVETNGTTVFAPTNRAFARLGPRANAFLFNSEKGLGFLKALLKYQVVANATLYSDAYYEKHGSEKGDVSSADERHFDLTTLLHDLPIRVDIKRWGGLVRFWVNGFTRVVVRDSVARNGVLHAVDKVPLPPHKHRAAQNGEDEEISVEDLVERLADYVEEDKETKETSRDWSDL